ncbi:cupin-like domain-containing protein [Pedobacter sp. WC2423]|uniref:cupin-like domain-containing protein n=1 Tax=Pedobacter sp. WC2423 TaxID=3234142 RepID=UPI0034669074
MIDNITDIVEMRELASKLFSAIPGIKDAGSIDIMEVKNLNAHDFKTKFLDKNTPCLIRSAVRHWPAVDKWKKQKYWVNTCDNREITIIPNINFFDLTKRMENSVNLSFHDAIERLFNNVDRTFSIPGQYIGESTLYSGLKDDIKGFSFLPFLAKPLWDREKSLFIYRRAATTWHVHYCDETLMCQVNGTKIVALISPNHSRPSYVTDFLENELYLRGQLMDQNLNLEPKIVEVTEGDALYIPPGWFHCVIPKDAEIGFTLACNFRSPLHINGNLSNYFTRKLYKKAWAVPSLKIKMIIPIYLFTAMCSYYLKKIIRL